MDTSISSSSISPAPEVSSSVIQKNIDPIGLIRRNKGWDNLKPAKKGERRNPSGKRKGTKSTKAAIERLVTTDDVNAIARSIIKGAVAGHDSKQDRFLKMRGELIPTEPVNPTTNNNTYNILITPEIIDMAKRFITDVPATIIDVNVSSPMAIDVSASMVSSSMVS